MEKIYVDKLNLEKLNFNIEGIGLRDLGGYLSIGINCGGKVIRASEGHRGEEGFSPEEPSTEKTRDAPRINFIIWRRWEP
ncbi:MAG TPA: hypothetical protein ENM97_03505 [Moorella mulderi]|nr:hypothetical protein [Moorella mulderi]